jgi:hypothetical protein
MAKYGDSAFAKWAAQEFDWDITPELIKLDVRTLNDDEWKFAAQREQDNQRAVGMAENWLPAVSAGVIVAETPIGRRLIMDGQTRCLAAYVAEQPYVWTLTFRNMDERQAAAMFRLKNGAAVRPSTRMDATMAASEARYTAALAINEVLARFDCHFERHTYKGSRKEGVVTTSRVVELIYGVDEGALLDKTLEVITHAWGHGRYALSAMSLEGVALFLAHNATEFTWKAWRELKEKMRSTTAEDVVDAALGAQKQSKSGGRRSAYFEAQLNFLYNYKRQDHTRIPERTANQLARLPDLERLAQMRRVERESEPELEPVD